MKMLQYTLPSLVQGRWYVLIIVMIGFLFPVYAQTGEEDSSMENQDDTTAVEEEASIEKLELRMSFEAFKINQTYKLLARVRSKVGAKFQNTAGVEVRFYQEEITPENIMGKDTSNHHGEAKWMFLPQPESNNTVSYTFWAVVQNHTVFEDVEETISINPSQMEMTLEEEDSIRTVKIFVGYPDETGQITPLSEVECNLYVKRLFGLLPIGEAETTDEEGNIIFEFPKEISGDESGYLTVVAKIVEHEMVGNVEVSKTIGWGIPVKTNNFYKQRQLWSARANSPIALIVVVNAALLGIWGVIAFIFLEIFRINRLGKTN